MHAAPPDGPPLSEKDSLVLQAESTDDVNAKRLPCSGRRNRRKFGALFFLVPLAGGLSNVLSAAINASNREAWGKGLWAATAAYAGAAVLAMMLAACNKERVHLHLLRDFLKARFWHIVVLTGGLLGAFQTVINTFAPKTIGVGLLFTIGIFGQLTVSILLDRFALLWSHQTQIPRLAILGYICVFLGSLLYRLTLIRKVLKGDQAYLPFVCYITAAAFYGASKAVQANVNSKFSSILGSYRYTMLLSFLSGVVILVPLTLLIEGGRPASWGAGAREWWRGLSGVFAVGAILGATGGAQLLGSGLTVCWQVCGQLILSTAVDHFGMFGLTKREFDLYNSLGSVFVLGGVLLVQAKQQPRPSDTSILEMASSNS